MGSLDQRCSSPSFTWFVHTIWMPGIYLRDDTQTTDQPMAQPVLDVFYWLRWVLLPRESWFWVVERHSTAWLYLFSYKRLRRSRREISKGTYSVTIVTSVPWDMEWVLRSWPSMSCTPQCGGEAYIVRRPTYFGGLHSHRLTRRRQAIGSFFSTGRSNGRAVTLRD